MYVVCTCVCLTTDGSRFTGSWSDGGTVFSSRAYHSLFVLALTSTARFRFEDASSKHNNSRSSLERRFGMEYCCCTYQYVWCKSGDSVACLWGGRGGDKRIEYRTKGRCEHLTAVQILLTHKAAYLRDRVVSCYMHSCVCMIYICSTYNNMIRPTPNSRRFRMQKK